MAIGPFGTFMHRRPRINPFGAGRSTNTFGKPESEVFGLIATIAQEDPLGYRVEPFGAVDTQEIFPIDLLIQAELFPFGAHGLTPVDFVI